MSMLQFTVTLIAFCIGLATLLATCKVGYWVLRKFIRAFDAVASIDGPENSGPNPDALKRFSGHVVDARNWHAQGGMFYAEFWIKDQNQQERRYKLEGVHPELRRGHKVTLTEYRDELVGIKNHSTGIELSVAPNSLLSPIYRTYRKRKVVLAIVLLDGLYAALLTVNMQLAEYFFIPILLINILLPIIVLVKHIVTYPSRNRARQREFSEFCRRNSAAG